MAHGMTRREFAMAAGAASLTGIGLSARTRASDTKTLRFIAQSDLRVLDPIWTTAGITRNHGYMVYDTPFALDAKFKPQPQMVGDYSISPDKLGKRDQQRHDTDFHDGENNLCIARELDPFRDDTADNYQPSRRNQNNGVLIVDQTGHEQL